MMNKNVESEIAIGVILLVAIVVGGIFWFSDENESAIKQILPNKKTRTEQASEIIINSDWQIYKSSSVGLQFKVPKDWKLLSSDNYLDYEIGTTNPRNSISVIITYGSNELTAETLFKQATDRQTENAHAWGYYNLKIVSIAGNSAISWEDYPGYQIHKKYLEIPRGNKLLRIKYTYDSFVSAENLDKILSTFKFASNNSEIDGAEPVMVVKKGLNNNELIIDDLHFKLPNDWIIAKEENSNAYIKDLNYKSNYDVFLFPAQVSKVSTEVDEYEMYQPIKINGGEIAIGEASSGQCSWYIVKLNGFKYEIIWDIDGNEPPPANSDGPWTPSNNFTESKIKEMMKTASMK
jgi:hypothetical protein